jgi:hypothetical protein
MFLRNCLFALIALPVLFAGCKKSDQYPIVPAITFKSLTTTKDAQGRDHYAVLEISFTDGDGDIGIDSSEVNTPPYIGEYSDVVHTVFYEKVNGVWTPNSQYDDNGRFQIITPQGNRKAIRGDIRKETIGLPPLVPDLHIRFDVYIYDRALHKSNVITTPEITVTTGPP